MSGNEETRWTDDIQNESTIETDQGSCDILVVEGEEFRRCRETDGTGLR